MSRKLNPLVAQHESWISLDPVRGCPASCVYCYLEPQGLTRMVPKVPEHTPEALYEGLLEYQYLEKSKFSDVFVDRRFPIAIGNYTDMCLTVKNRQYLLTLLHEHKQRMPKVPVCIVTKAVLDQAFLGSVNELGITVIFFISLSFLPMKLEKGTTSIEARLQNFERIAQFEHIRAIHFWRPVTSLSVPDHAAALKQIEQLQDSGASVSVMTGLKFGNNLSKTFSSNEQHALHKFFEANVVQEHLKNEILEPEVQEIILSVAREKGYPVFLHTSCAVSSLLEQPDYNATFRKPHLDSKCLASVCTAVQRERCSDFKSQYVLPSETVLEQVAQYLNLPSTSVTYLEEQEVIVAGCVLTQEEQTFLTQATGFPVRGQSLVPTLEWIGSINR